MNCPKILDFQILLFGALIKRAWNLVAGGQVKAIRWSSKGWIEPRNSRPNVRLIMALEHLEFVHYFLL